MMSATKTTRQRRNLSSWLGLSSALACAFGLTTGCLQEEVVGQADGGGDANCAGCAPDDWEPSGHCAEEDADLRAAYDAWRRSPNDLGELRGTRWEGYVEGGPDIELVFEGDGTATLHAGVPQAPVAELGYLCTEDSCGPPGLLEGGSYALHGATYENSRFRSPIHYNSARDEWCAMQTPLEVVHDECHFYPLVSETHSGDVCTHEDVVVDCDWLTVLSNETCRCVSTGCFGDIEALNISPGTLDLTFDASDQRFDGAIAFPSWDTTYTANVRLFPAN